MRVCDFQSGIGQLQRETKALQEKWAQTKLHWRDATARDFESTYLEPLLPQLKLALAATYELSDLVAKAEHELGDSEA